MSTAVGFSEIEDNSVTVTPLTGLYTPKTDEEAFAIAWGIYNDKARQKRNYYDEGFFGKF